MLSENGIFPENRYLPNEVRILTLGIDVEKLAGKIVTVNKTQADQEPKDQILIKSVVTPEGTFNLSLSYDGAWGSNIILGNFNNSINYALSVYAVVSERQMTSLFTKLYDDLRTNIQLFTDSKLQSEAFKLEQRRTLSLFDARLELYVFENTEILLKNLKRDLKLVLGEF